MSKLQNIVQGLHPNLRFFILTTAFLGMTNGMFESVFNNYLDDVFHISATTRGFLEFPRELPGFLVAIVSGLLFFLVEVRMAAVATLAIALGLWGLGFLSSSIGTMILWMVIWSAGNHLYMPLSQAIGVEVAEKGQVGRRLGQVGGVQTAAVILGAVTVWIGLDMWNFSYSHIFFLGGASALAAGYFLLHMDISPHKNTTRRKFIYRQEYKLFYWMAVLFGARKQVFITFGPWVLIKIFDEPASTIAKLWMASSLLGIFFRPLLGRLIDSWGERNVLVADAMALIAVCIGYGFGSHWGGETWGLRIVYACFVLDQLLFAVGMARTTYLHKIAVEPGDLTPSLSLGVSIDHAVSMVVPALGGIIWVLYGYPYVFLAAAGIALVNMFVCSRIRIPAPEPATGKAAVSG